MQFHENFEPQKFGAIYTVHVHVNHQKKKKTHQMYSIYYTLESHLH